MDAVGALLVGAVLTLFGVIHLVDPRGGIYLPWDVEGWRATIRGSSPRRAGGVAGFVVPAEEAVGRPWPAVSRQHADGVQAHPA